MLSVWEQKRQQIRESSSLYVIDEPFIETVPLSFQRLLFQKIKNTEDASYIRNALKTNNWII